MIMKASFVYITACLVILLASVPGQACDFFFNYPQVDGALGVTGSIAIRVLKHHVDCSLIGMEGYELDCENVEVIQETEWVEVENNLFEKWIRIVLSEIGEGYFVISKDCSTEGYDEKRLPIIVRAGGGIWETAFYEGYPYETNLNILSVGGPYELMDNSLVIENRSFSLPTIPKSLLEYDNDIVLYYTQASGSDKVLLIVGDTIFCRFDHHYNFD